ncbi:MULTISPECIES: hypothetical protein [unclassified Methylophilus]|uniref:DUF6985 domain-containing protein n=1 Tax=unclassified Methylophilus TaxID=2630143 RepID=UPI0006F67831|nr:MULTISPECIES: hypothetical protein [unclassified Methylophilus]KQT42496.1 hypothetical protein ASG34_07060 [Methylophilus sp. Leaf416]KQT56679.1 hypothetical protein ASG44_07035 [Methylophilus sp. Leaf459]
MKPLLKNVSTEGFWPLQGEAFLTLFDRYVPFAVEDASGINYVEKCVEYFNALDSEIIDDLCLASIRYCNDFLEMVGEDPKQFNSPRDVLPLVIPSTLIIPNEEIPGQPVAHFELNCDWEPEHGMEWIVRDNKVLYVGGFNGSDPWGEYLEKPSYNYA